MGLKGAWFLGRRHAHSGNMTLMSPEVCAVSGKTHPEFIATNRASPRVRVLGTWCPRNVAFSAQPPSQGKRPRFDSRYALFKKTFSLYEEKNCNVQ